MRVTDEQKAALQKIIPMTRGETRSALESLLAASAPTPSDKQEAVAYLSTEPRKWDQCRIKPQGSFTIPVFTHAERNEPLTDEEIEEISHQRETWSVIEFARAILAAAPVANPSDKQEICGNCNGTGRMVRDPDIGTDQECFACDGTGRFETSDKQEAVAWINAESNYCTSDPIAAKHVDGLKPVYAAPIAQSAEQDMIDAERFPYQQTFDAIAFATKIEGGGIAISVEKFRKAFGTLAKGANK